MTGSDDVLDIAFQRSGVLRVNDIAELFYMAEVLARQPRPKGPRLTILTNAGGPGVLAADALLLGGGELADSPNRPSPNSTRSSHSVWSRGNPIDIIGDAEPARYAKSLEIAAKDPNSDGLLVILTPQAMTDCTQTAEHLAPYAKLGDKPVLASWMGGRCRRRRTDPQRRRHPHFRLPRYRRPHVQLHVEVHPQPVRPLRDPPPRRSSGEAEHARASEIIEKVR
jgi:acetyltransferase